MPTATLSSKGQITIPKTIRERLHLHAGDRILFILERDGMVTMRPATKDLSALKGLLKKPGRETLPVEKMQQAIMDQVVRDHAP